MSIWTFTVILFMILFGIAVALGITIMAIDYFTLSMEENKWTR